MALFENRGSRREDPFKLSALTELRFFEPEVQVRAFDAVVDIGEGVEKGFGIFLKALGVKYKGQ